MDIVSSKWKYIGAKTINVPFRKKNNWLRYEFSTIKNWVSLYQNGVKLLSKKLLEKLMVLLSKKILHSERLKCMTNKKLQSY